VRKKINIQKAKCQISWPLIFRLGSRSSGLFTLEFRISKRYTHTGRGSEHEEEGAKRINSISDFLLPALQDFQTSESKN
jgi:hypothetical protein